MDGFNILGNFATKRKSEVDHEKVQGEGWHDERSLVTHQGIHASCWTEASSGNITDARFHRGIDETRTRYSSTFLLDVVDHDKAYEKLGKSDGEHSCYGYSTFKAMEYIMNNGIPKHSDWTFPRKCNNYIPRLPSHANRVHVLNDVRCFTDVHRAIHYLKDQPIIGAIALFSPEFPDIGGVSVYLCSSKFFFFEIFCLCVSDALIIFTFQNLEYLSGSNFTDVGRSNPLGVMKVTNVNKLTSAGCKVKIWIADWFAQLNNKLGGDLEKIKVVGEYFKEIWEAGGMNPEKVEFLWASDEISTRGNTYWPLVMDIARRNNLRRILRCGQIMERSETEVLSAAQILYPCMQCADIFFLEADICQLGMDQRKVNMLAREYCDDIKRKNKPIILSHHMLPGLRQGQEKMSKSDPSSAIFMEDEEYAVNKKISKAHCPERTVAGNPCFEYVKYLVLPRFNEFVVENEKNGGNKTFTSFEDIAADYESGELSREDLKKALIKALNIMLQPVRHHFKTNERAKNLLKQVKLFGVTR
ncbi:unnamed protein product [Brassica napus]|uniref:tyrosine--tRNA ligase n=1 Tax=Brassica napus TaxID=3708 RepID=A0A816ZRC1_BRANA|nr:unnamed protein product [Brassica napus]